MQSHLAFPMRDRKNAPGNDAQRTWVNTSVRCIEAVGHKDFRRATTGKDLPTSDSRFETGSAAPGLRNPGGLPGYLLIRFAQAADHLGPEWVVATPQ